MIKAKYYSPHELKFYDVDLHFQNDELLGIDPLGHCVVQWRYHSIRVARKCAPPVPGIIKNGEDSGSGQIHIFDPGYFKQIKKRIKKTTSFQKKLFYFSSIALYTLLLMTILYYAFTGLPRWFAQHFPQKLSDHIGNKGLHEITQEFKICRNAKANQVLKKIYQPILDVSETRPDIKFYIVDSPQVNAVTLPGSYILVYYGLIDKARDPRVISGILAHEISHAIFQHPLQGLIKEMSLSLLSMVLFKDNNLSGIEYLITMKYTRDAEREADHLAQKFMNILDINTKPMSDFLQTLDPGDDIDALFTFTSSHPSTNERVKLYKQNFRGHNMVLTPAEWRTLKRACD